MLGTLFQEAFLHFLHNGIFLLALDVEHWVGFRRTGKKYSHFGFHDREQKEQIGFSHFPKLGFHKRVYRMDHHIGTF